MARPLSWLTFLLTNVSMVTLSHLPFICLHLHLFPQVGILVSFIRLSSLAGRFLSDVHSLHFLLLLYPSGSSFSLSQLLQVKHGPCLQEAGCFRNRDDGD